MSDRICWRCDDQGCSYCSMWCLVEKRWVFMTCGHAPCRITSNGADDE